jgi:hypothetical protein
VAAVAGEGHEVQTWTGKNRVRITVRTITRSARRREAKDRNLLRAIDAAR